MIKINLLGSSTAIDHSSRFILVGYAGSVILAVLGLSYAVNVVQTEVKDLQAQVTDVEARLTNLRRRTKSVEDLEKKKKLINSKLALVAKLRRSKIGPVRVMDDLNIAVPERVWLRQLVEKDGVLSIKGRALDNQDVALFMRNLSASDYFQSIDLQESRQMLYSRRTGQVVAQTETRSLRSQSPDFQTERRVTRGAATDMGDQKRWAVRATGSSRDRDTRSRVDENFVRINEFILSAKVNYYGRLQLAQAEQVSAASEPARRR